MAMNVRPEARNKVTDKVPASAWSWRDQSIDDLLHKNALCGFDTAIEDPFGPDWAAALRTFRKSTRQ